MNRVSDEELDHAASCTPHCACIACLIARELRDYRKAVREYVEARNGWERCLETDADEDEFNRYDELRKAAEATLRVLQERT